MEHGINEAQRAQSCRELCISELLLGNCIEVQRPSRKNAERSSDHQLRKMAASPRRASAAIHIIIIIIIIIIILIFFIFINIIIPGI